MNRRPMQARYAGQCRCGAHFEKGCRIIYDTWSRSVVACPTCGSTRQSEPDLARQSDMDYEDQCAAACGPGL